MTPMLDGWTPWPEEFVDRYRSIGHWRGVTLDNLLSDTARRQAPRTALVHGATRLTYGLLNRRVERTAAGFRLRGLRRGQRVVVRLPNVPEAVIALFALLRVGAVPVVCPVALGGRELAHVVRVSEAAGLVGTASHRSEVAEIAAEGPFLRRAFTYEPPGTESPYGGMSIDSSGCHFFPLGSVDAAPEPAPVHGAGEVAFLLVVPGPDGTPRLVPRTHDAYAYQVRASGAAVGLSAQDVHLAALPAESLLASGCPGILGTLLCGGTVVLADDPGPAACLPLVADEQVTVATLAPAGLEAWQASDPGPLKSLRLILTPSTGSDQTGRELDCETRQFLTLPEGVAALSGSGESTFHPLTSDDEFTVDRDGDLGELLVRGPSVTRGYYRAPDADAEAFTSDGRFRTGVLVRRGADGGLLVTGRAGA
ncbi:AMP-binding protein [Streptomyces xanthii]|uniref:AMP-binding protein n=1 Tax=Streptomyces xanthii TaxID=2768069 RepID=A0A7H1BGZ7_9ACTN|nr:AMP-binding protein [Streptomyces xanthii]QNS08002.1 AMP-binding protein [Streptomyces xanthii]